VRILWHSSSPSARTGYGIVTREIVKRLREAGHFVRVGTKHEAYKWEVQADGLEVFEGTDVYLINQMLEQENFDFICTLWDIWILAGKRQYPKKKWVAYVPVNTLYLHEHYKQVLENTSLQIAQTRFGERVMRDAGFSPVYAPHGIDTTAYCPDAAARAQFQSEIGWTDENFVIGLVGINYGDDTKGVIPLLLAFKEFHAEHPEARLFLHTLANERDAIAESVNYERVVKLLGLEGLIGWPFQSDYFYTRLGDADMRRIYNGMDVFCLPSRGESFGLPIVEAQACGVPVIVPGITSGPELCKSGWTIDVDLIDDAIWSPSGVWRYYLRPRQILRQLEYAYRAWQGKGCWADMKATAREGVLEYDWDLVWPEYWEPIVKGLEDRLTESQETKS
jgi:glycosyltransferase involved in cell wall biosynthesis